jgi:hypothetical protein
MGRKEESGKYGQMPPIYFAELEEAIVAELTDRLYHEKIATDPSFHSEMQALDHVKAWVRRVFQKAGRTSPEQQDEMLKYFRAITPGAAANLLPVLESGKLDENYKIRYLAGNLQALMEKGELGIVERYDERKKLHNLLDELVKRNPHDGPSSTKEELFAEFARANFTGNYLALARIVEDRMGKGAFRRLAENSKLGSSASSWL